MSTRGVLNHVVHTSRLWLRKVTKGLKPKYDIVIVGMFHARLAQISITNHTYISQKIGGVQYASRCQNDAVVDMLFQIHSKKFDVVRFF